MIADTFALQLENGPLDGLTIRLPRHARAMAIVLGKVVLQAFGGVNVPAGAELTDDQIAATAYPVIYVFDGLLRTAAELVTVWTYDRPFEPR